MSYLHPLGRSTSPEDRHRALLRWRRRGRILTASLVALSVLSFALPSIGASWGALGLILAATAGMAGRALPDWFRCSVCGSPASEETDGGDCAHAA